MSSRFSPGSVIAALTLAVALGGAYFSVNGAQPRQAPSEASKATRPVAAATVMLPNFADLAERQGPSVVNISTTQARPKAPPQSRRPPRGQPGPENDPFHEFFRRFMPPDEDPDELEGQSLGSGFIVSTDGYILTNRHVVANADEVLVRLSDKREFKAKIVGTDRRTDVAVLKIEAQGLPAVTVGRPDKLRVGEWVVAIGSPFGFDSSVTAGIVSAKGRSLPDETYVPFIQTDVAINPGNSGGPLFNLDGEVVGINAQIFSQTGGYMGLSFAIPIDVAMEVADQLRTKGRVSRGKLGVVIQEVNDELAASFGLDKARGALVAAVEKGSAADGAGIQPGDVIIEYNGKPVETHRDLPRMVASTKPGADATVKVWRKGKALDFKLAVGEFPPDEVAAKAAEAPAAAPQAAVNRLGLRLLDLTPVQRRELGLDNGVAVEDVEGAAARAGLEPGDLILAVNNNDVSNVEQFEKLLAGFKAGQHIALLVRRDGRTLFVPMRISGE